MARRALQGLSPRVCGTCSGAPCTRGSRGRCGTLQDSRQHGPGAREVGQVTQTHSHPEATVHAGDQATQATRLPLARETQDRAS